MIKNSSYLNYKLLISNVKSKILFNKKLNKILLLLKKSIKIILNYKLNCSLN